MSTPNNADGKWIVTQNGQRASAVIETEKKALEEAAKIRQESKASTVKPLVETKKNLYG